MSSQLANPNREAAIWARLMRGPGDDLSPEAAEYLLSIRLSEPDASRLRELADRSESGTLTDEEKIELDSYLHVGNLLAVMQSRARLARERHRP